MEARCLRETQRRAGALSGLGGQRERDLLAQGGAPILGAKPPGRGAANPRSPAGVSPALSCASGPPRYPASPRL